MATLTCGTCGSDSPDGARFCANCGSPLEAARPLEGERRFATVLFADVAGSTSIAERLDPEDWTQIINGAFGFMNAAVARYGGTVSRLMGDAVLALFGAPVAHEDDAERAVRAALEMQEAGQAYARVVRALPVAARDRSRSRRPRNGAGRTSPRSWPSTRTRPPPRPRAARQSPRRATPLRARCAR